MHWQRVRKHGSPYSTKRYAAKRGCLVDGCDRKHYIKGYCRPHHRHIFIEGRSPYTLRNSQEYVPTYSGAHKRVRYLWGSASQYPCAHCGGTAEQWAYDHSDSEELEEMMVDARHGAGAKPKMMAYSRWPEFYMPLCKYCHTVMDHV